MSSTKVRAAEEDDIEQPVEEEKEEVEVEEQVEKEEVEVEEPVEEEEDEEEVEDPQETLKVELASSCQKYQTELDACTERVSSRSNTSETCEQELYDFLHCRDCKVAEKLFSKLK